MDADPRLPRLAPEWRRDIEAHRAEIGVIARADPGTEAQILERRRRRAIDLPRIDETDDAEIAEAIARLERQLVHAAAADRKIGRASCRERVWQYVLISEVPVSIKKKRIKK